MPFHVNRTERTRRAKVLTSAATDATLGVDNRNLQRFRVALLRRNHLYGSRRAMARTVTALHAVGQGDTVILYPYRMPDLDRRLLRQAYRTDGSCRADLAALRTFRTAIAPFIRHLRLHQLHQIAGRAQHLIRADRHAQLACRAVLQKMARAPCTRRHNRRSTRRNLFLFDDGKSAIHFFLLRFQQRSRSQTCRSGQERTTRSRRLFHGSLLTMPMQSMQETQRL